VSQKVGNVHWVVHRENPHRTANALVTVGALFFTGLIAYSVVGDWATQGLPATLKIVEGVGLMATPLAVGAVALALLNRRSNPSTERSGEGRGEKVDEPLLTRGVGEERRDFANRLLHADQFDRYFEAQAGALTGSLSWKLRRAMGEIVHWPEEWQGRVGSTTCAPLASTLLSRHKLFWRTALSCESTRL